MTRLIEVLISLAIVTALFLLVALVLPSSRHLEEKVETNRKMTIVYDTLNSLRRFTDWNPLALRDPKMDVELSGPVSGVGAKLSYESDKAQVGDGSWTIVATEPNKSVTYALENNQRGHDKTMTFHFKPTGRSGRNVEITQNYDVKYGWDLLGRYAGLYVSRHVGDDMQLGLERLTNMLAQVPNNDYRVQGSTMADMQFVKLPAENLLVVSAGAIERNNQKIESAMKADLEWIHRTMAANNLVATGPVRIITSDFGRETYTFDVAVPVRKAGAAAADESGEDAAAEGEGEDTGAKSGNAPRAEIVAAAGEPLSGLELLGPVQYLRTEGGRAATATYKGYMAELENVRDALRAWTLTQGEEAIGRPFEVYKNGIDQAFTADGQYDVYWMIK